MCVTECVYIVIYKSGKTKLTFVPLPQKKREREKMKWKKKTFHPQSIQTKYIFSSLRSFSSLGVFHLFSYYFAKGPFSDIRTCSSSPSSSARGGGGGVNSIQWKWNRPPFWSFFPCHSISIVSFSFFFLGNIGTFSLSNHQSQLSFWNQIKSPRIKLFLCVLICTDADRPHYALHRTIVPIQKLSQNWIHWLTST